MGVYYSIISVLIRPEIEEKISVGLLVSSGDDLFLRFSKSKLSIVRDLLPRHLYNGLKQEVKGIGDLYAKMKTPASIDQSLLSPSKQLFEASRINYLSKYKNNLLTFSQTQEITSFTGLEVFNKLYATYIDSEFENTELANTVKPIEQFRNDIVPTLSKYYNTHFTLTANYFPGALMPLQFDLAGKNDIEVFASSIDLERRKYNVEHDINAFYPIKDLSPTSKKFLVTKEPDKKFAAQHRIWENIRDSGWLEYVDVSEAERLEVYAKEHGVEPLVNNPSSITTSHD